MSSPLTCSVMWNLKNDFLMHINLNLMQRKPWHERMSVLVGKAYRIAKEHQNPLKNDSSGVIDCYQLDDKLNDCMNILNRYKKK